jgi:hypothetical protein
MDLLTKNKNSNSLIGKALVAIFGVCLVLGILNLVVESERDEKNKKIVSQSAKGVVGGASDPTAQKENEASKEGGNTSQVRNGKSESTSLDEKGSSADSKNKILRKVAPYASGVMRPTSPSAPKNTKPFEIDRSQTISQILESADLNDPQTRATVVAYMSEVEEARYEAVLQKAELLEIPVRVDGPGNKVSILYDFRGEEPVYRTTMNANAAISSGANLLYSAPYSLNGTGVKVGVWDAGSVRNTHREFTTARVVKRNSSVALDDHATHVAGTIGASGFTTSAKGMAPNVSIDSWDWNSDYAEMTSSGAASATADASKIPLSNHSYGYNATTADMGVYNSESVDTDALAVSMPFYLICWAAGNEQDLLTAKGGFQSITYNGLSKNILTVGAVNDAVSGGVRSPAAGTMSSFSSWGPCDDGRIKPDVVANGVSVNSPIDTSDSAYASYSGTSMATPSATGSAALLAQIYAREFSGQRMRASLLKALLIHTADDLGNAGPDYKFGWGLINVKAAADVILAHKVSLVAPKMIEDSVTTSASSRTHTFQWDGVSPIRATLCWTDPAGTAQADNSRTANLRHNLDLTITAPNGTVLRPYVMPFVGNWTDAAMNSVATTGKNNVDNVEQVYLAAPTQAGTYTITVSRDGALTTSSQVYSLVVTGSENVEANPPPVVNILAPTNGDTVLPGSPVTITATATDLAVGGQPGQVTKVEFFDGSTLLGEDTSAPYQFSWVNATSGAHVITAKATDNEGASTISSAVNVNVLIGSGAPTITSFSPTTGVAGDSVVISGDNLGIASSVRFGALAATFTANSSSQITAVVPANAVTAPITVSNNYGSVTTSSNFTIIPIVFREDFASLTTGNNTTTTGSSTVWAGNINFPTGVNDYQAGGAVKLGTSWLAGSITSRAINLAGNGGAFTVSLKVKGWSTREGDIKVTAGAQTQTVTYTATMSGDFETKTLSFTGGTSATTIKIETTAKRAFLDDVTVYAEAPSSPPVITSPSTAGGIVGQAFSYQITASNTPTSYGATNLPAWASINTTNGLISGPNPTAGTNVVTISASNSVGVGSTNLTIAILPSGGGGTTSTIFSENMGAPTANTSIAANTFQNSGTLSFAGTGDVRTSTPSSGYTGASGGGNVFITQTANLFFEISGINAARYTDLTLSLGHYKSTTASSNELAIEVSADGTNYTPLSYSRASGSGTAVWALVNPTGTIPSATNLRIRFRQTSASTQFRIDDVKLTGVATTPSPSISATGSLSAVNTVYGTASTNPTSFTLSGSDLVAGITVAPPGGFQLSVANTNNFASAGNSIMVGSGGTISGTTVFVRLAADTPVGSYSGNIVCSSPGASNIAAATVASTVSPKPISVTADSLRKTYGNLDPELTYTPSEVAPFSGGLVRDAGEAAGSYRIRLGSLTAGSNYVISFNEVDFAILKKRLSVIANDRTKAFGQILTLGAGQTGFTTSEMVSTDKIDTVTITASGGTEANDPAGTYHLTPSAPVGQNFAAGNYDIYYTLGTLTVNQGSATGPTFGSWAGQGVELTPELLMKYAIGGAANSSVTGELPVVGMDGSNLTLTALVRKDSTLAIVGQAVANLEDYGTPASVTSLTGTSEGVSQIGVPTDCERKIFKSTLTGSKSFLRLSVQKQ